MLKVSSGEIKVNDFDATKEADKVRGEIGILFGGEVGLYDRLTGRENKTIVFSSHSMTEVEKLCDRVIIIHKGKLIENGTVEELNEKYKNQDLEDVFVSLIGGDCNE